MDTASNDPEPPRAVIEIGVRHPSPDDADAPAGRPPVAGGVLIARWDAMETAFAVGCYGGNPHLLKARVGRLREVAAGTYVLPGSKRPDVVVTAVHGTNHTRDGRTKWADRGTGSLALLLAEATGVTALITLGTGGDANHDFTHPAKTAILALDGVRAVVDLHGSAHLPDSPDIEIGTAAGHVPAGFIDQLTGWPGLRVVVDVARPARNPRRIAMLAQTYGVRSLQLEIDALLRPPSGDPARRGQLLKALVSMLTTTPYPVPATSCSTGQEPPR